MHIAKQKKGSVLFIVLWVIFFLSTIALVIGYYVSPQMNLAFKFKTKAEARTLAEAGVKKAMAILNTEDPEKLYSSLNDGWSRGDGLKGIKLGQGEWSVGTFSSAKEFKVGLADEERKININKASADVLKKLFETYAGVSELAAQEIAASILRWHGPQAKPEEECPDNSYYRSLSPSYVCKNKDFEVLDELLLVKGITRQIFNKVQDKLTVYGPGAVNINTAGRSVLQCLGLSASLVEKIMEFRNGADGQEGTGDDNIAKSTESLVSEMSAKVELTTEDQTQLTEAFKNSLLGIYSHYFRGSSVSTLEGNAGSVRIDFVIGRAYDIKFWREE
jgi:general secretion pathway protein K